MTSAMRKLWSDPEFLKMIETQHANGVVASAACGQGERGRGRFRGNRVVRRNTGRLSSTPAASRGHDATSPCRSATGPVAQPVHKNGKPNESDAVAEANRKFASRFPNGPKQPRFSHPGDGEVVPLERAFDELGKKSGIVLESGSRAFHREIWQKYMGNQGKPPIAFKYAGRIRIDIMALTPEELERFLVLSKAQAAAIAIGGGDRNGTSSRGATGDTHPKSTRHESSQPHANPSNGNGRGSNGTGLPGNTQVSHPPPPPSRPPAEPGPNGDAVFRYPPRPGDGEIVPIERALKIMGRKTGQVMESGSQGWHRKLWQEQLGNPGEPPVAFTYSGKIRVDVERLTPQQLEMFIKLDQAQAAAIAAGAATSPIASRAAPAAPKAVAVAAPEVAMVEVMQAVATPAARARRLPTRPWPTRSMPMMPRLKNFKRNLTACKKSNPRPLRANSLPKSVPVLTPNRRRLSRKERR